MVGYCDLTDDKKEEAIVMLFPLHSGTAINSFVYIYTLQGNKPKLIWFFVTGDRADGGFKELYVENGELVIELKGKTNTSAAICTQRTTHQAVLAVRQCLHAHVTNGTANTL